MWPWELRGCLENYINQERISAQAERRRKERTFRRKTAPSPLLWVHISYLRLALSLFISTFCVINVEVTALIYIITTIIITFTCLGSQQTSSWQIKIKRTVTQYRPCAITKKNLYNVKSFTNSTECPIDHIISHTYLSNIWFLDLYCW